MRGFTRFVLWYAAVVVILAAFGLVLGALKISTQRNEVATNILGPHGIVFGLVLPTMIFAFVPIFVIWIVSRIASLLRKNR
jgi:hypothetical protein